MHSPPRTGCEAVALDGGDEDEVRCMLRYQAEFEEVFHPDDTGPLEVGQVQVEVDQPADVNDMRHALQELQCTEVEVNHKSLEHVG